MKRVNKYFYLVIVTSLLSACGTMKTSDNDAQEKKLRVAELNIQMGMAYLDAQDVSRAKQKLLVAMDTAPNLPEVWYSLGYFYEATGNYDEANTDYLKAIALAPGRGDTENNYGTFLCHAGKYKQSIQHFELALKDPNYLDAGAAYENAGLCAMKIPDNKMAIRYFKLALMQDPKLSVSQAYLSKLTANKSA